MPITPSRSAQEDLNSYFKRSASKVQAYADQIERSYARPALKTSQIFFQQHPISATYITIFSLLSFLPITLFVGFSLVTLASFSIVAILSFLVASVLVMILFLSILVCTLLANIFLAAFLASLVALFYVLTRLAILARAGGLVGISQWAGEIQDNIRYPRHIISSNHPQEHRPQEPADETTHVPEKAEQMSNSSSEDGVKVEH